jgi:hypothetical protein
LVGEWRYEENGGTYAGWLRARLVINRGLGRDQLKVADNTDRIITSRIWSHVWIVTLTQWRRKNGKIVVMLQFVCDRVTHVEARHVEAQHS